MDEVCSVELRTARAACGAYRQEAVCGLVPASGIVSEHRLSMSSPEHMSCMRIGGGGTYLVDMRLHHLWHIVHRREDGLLVLYRHRGHGRKAREQAEWLLLLLRRQIGRGRRQRRGRRLVRALTVCCARTRLTKHEGRTERRDGCCGSEEGARWCRRCTGRRRQAKNVERRQGVRDTDNGTGTGRLLAVFALRSRSNKLE